MTTHRTVKTVEVTTPHGVVTVPRVTHHVVCGRNYYTSHLYNSMAQRRPGGFDFPAWNPKSCEHYGVPVMPETATD